MASSMNGLHALFDTLSGLLDPPELALCLVQLERVPGEEAAAFLTEVADPSNAILAKARELTNQFSSVRPV